VALVLLLVAGITASTWLAVRAHRAEAAARDAEKAESERAEGERRANAGLAATNAALAAEQAKVQARFDMAMKAIALFHTGVSEDMLLKNAEFEGLRTKLLREAGGFYADMEKLLAGQTDTKSRKTLAEGYFQLGELTDKIGSKPEALVVHRKALALRRELAAAKGADVETRLDVARSLNAVGDLLLQTGDRAQALSVLQEVRDLAVALEAESPTGAVSVQLAFAHNGIAFMLTDMGKPAEALDSYRKALEIYQKLSEAGQYLVPSQGPTFGGQLQAGTYMSIAYMLDETGKSAEGLESYRKAWDILQKLANANPANTSVQTYLAKCHNYMGVALYSMGKPEEAITQLRKMLSIFQKLADAHPAVAEFQFDLAVAHDNIAITLSKTGRPEEAIQANQKALAIFQKLANGNPTVLQYRLELATAYNNFGRLLARQKRFAEAFTALDAGLALRQKLAEADPENTAYRIYLGWSHADRGRALVRSGQPSKAAADLQQAVELWAKEPVTDLETRVERLRALALLASLGGDAKSGVTKAEAARFADQAVAALRDAINAGLSQLDELKEPDFDALRGRDDFKKLVAGVEAKAAKKQAESK
jgi:tetratricopeptide (TPR) repeat protein